MVFLKRRSLTKASVWLSDCCLLPDMSCDLSFTPFAPSVTEPSQEPASCHLDIHPPELWGWIQVSSFSSVVCFKHFTIAITQVFWVIQKQLVYERCAVFLGNNVLFHRWELNICAFWYSWGRWGPIISSALLPWILRMEEWVLIFCMS